ncbi:hypothetical protein CCYA_CCYA03G0961 [Cyanidiococcus yangmingshanensis]|nr:hypothetical protein CCYA_CCYA03G0961 [Cyanidiococcus yangmingshanensis]
MESVYFRWQLPRQVEDAASAQPLERAQQLHSQTYVARLVQNRAASRQEVSLLVVAGSWLFLLRPPSYKSFIEPGDEESRRTGQTTCSKECVCVTRWRLPRQLRLWSCRRLGVAILPELSALQVTAIGSGIELDEERAERHTTRSVMRVLTTTLGLEATPATAAWRAANPLSDSSRDIPLEELLDSNEDPNQIMDIVALEREGHWALILGAEHLLVIDARSSVRVLRPCLDERLSKTSATLRRWFHQMRSWTRVPAPYTHLTDTAERYACTFGYGGCVQMRAKPSESVLFILRQNQIETWRVTDSQVALLSVSSTVLDQLSSLVHVDRSDIIPLYLNAESDAKHSVLCVATFTTGDRSASDRGSVPAESARRRSPDDRRYFQLQLWAVPLRHGGDDELAWVLGEPAPLGEVAVASIETIFLNLSWALADGFVFVFDKLTRMLRWGSAVWGLRAFEQVHGETMLRSNPSDPDHEDSVCGFGAASKVGAICLYANGSVDQFMPPYPAPIGVQVDPGRAAAASPPAQQDRAWHALMTVLILEAADESAASAASLRNARIIWDPLSFRAAVQRLHDMIMARDLVLISNAVSEEAALESQLIWLRRLCRFLLTHPSLAAPTETNELLWNDLQKTDRIGLTQSIYSLYIALALRRMLNAKPSASWSALSRHALHESLIDKMPSEAVPASLSALHNLYSDQRARYLASETDIFLEFLSLNLEAAYYAAGLLLNGVCAARAELPELIALERAACPWLHEPKAPFSLLLQALTEELPGYLAQQKHSQSPESLQILYEVVKSRLELERTQEGTGDMVGSKALDLLERLRLAGLCAEAARLAREYGVFEILMRIAQEAESTHEDPEWAAEFLDTCFAELGQPFAWYAFDWWFERQNYVALFARKSSLLRDWLLERHHDEWIWLHYIADENYAGAAAALLKAEAECTTNVQDAIFYLSTAIVCCRLAGSSDPSLEAEARLRLQRARAYKRLGLAQFRSFEELVCWFKETGAYAPLPDLALNALLLLQVADTEHVDSESGVAVLDALVHREWYLWQRLVGGASQMNDIEKESLLGQTALHHVLQQRPEFTRNRFAIDRLCVAYPSAARYLRQCFTLSAKPPSEKEN